MVCSRFYISLSVHQEIFMLKTFKKKYLIGVIIGGLVLLGVGLYVGYQFAPIKEVFVQECPETKMIDEACVNAGGLPICVYPRRK